MLLQLHWGNLMCRKSISIALLYLHKSGFPRTIRSWLSGHFVVPVFFTLIHPQNASKECWVVYITQCNDFPYLRSFVIHDLILNRHISIRSTGVLWGQRVVRKYNTYGFLPWGWPPTGNRIKQAFCMLGWGILRRLPRFRYFPHFSASPKYVLLYVTFIFDRCYRGWAAVTHVKSECDAESNKWFDKIENLA